VFLLTLLKVSVGVYDKPEEFLTFDVPPNKAFQPSAGSAFLTLAFVAVPAPAERGR